MGGGSILAGLVLGAIGVFVIERDFVKASAFAFAGAVLTYFGFMHGEAVGIGGGFGVTPAVALAYAVVAAAFFAWANTAPAAFRLRIPTCLMPCLPNEELTARRNNPIVAGKLANGLGPERQLLLAGHRQRRDRIGDRASEGLAPRNFAELFCDTTGRANSRLQATPILLASDCRPRNCAISSCCRLSNRQPGG